MDDQHKDQRARLASLDADLAGINIIIAGCTNGDALSVLYHDQDRLVDEIEKLKNQIKLGITSASN